MDEDTADNLPLTYQGYFDDDCLMIAKIIEANWNNEVFDKPVFYYLEDKDISQFQFNTGEIPIKITADELNSSPKGISFDSVDESRTIHINIRSLDRETVIKVVDELRRIFYKYRLRPGNMWDTLWLSSYAPVYPSYHFYNGNLTITMRRYCMMIPYPNSVQDWNGPL